METVAGLFKNYADAEKAVDELQTAGFERSAISVLAREASIAEKMGQEPRVSDVTSKAGVGAVSGGVGGGLIGLLAGLGALLIPGIGPVVAAGSLATTLGLMAGGAGVGAAVGGIVGAMTGLSISEEEAQVYAEGVKRGGILVAVQAHEDLAAQARDILRDAEAQDTKMLREEWEREGWTRFEGDEFV
jgi:uncharacterized membrane protein